MAVSIGATTACLTVQQILENVAQGNVTTFKITNHGMLQAITSGMNTSGFESIRVQDPGGKNLTTNIEYFTNPRTAASTSSTTICDTGSTISPKYASVATDSTAKVTVTLNEEEFRSFCRPRADGVLGSLFAEQITQTAVNQLLDQVDQDAVTYAATHTGNFYGSEAGPRNVTLIRSDGSPYHGGATKISNDLEDAGVVGTPFAVGLGYWRTYSKTAELACCDQTGIDLNRMAGSPWIYYSDRKVDETVADTNNAFILAPGALQIVSRTTWVGPYEDFQDDNHVKTTNTITVPGGGSFDVDFTIYKDFCGTGSDGQTSYVLTWIARYGFFSLPSDLENAGSPYRSVNGIFHYTADCGDITCASDVPS